MTQIIEITASEGLTSPTAKAYANGNDTLAATASSVAAAANRDGLYLMTFTGLANGVYRVELADSAGVAAVRYVVSNAASGTFSEYVSPAAVDSNAIATAVIAGLGSVEITRIGAEYDPVTRKITLRAGDDYSIAGLNAASFTIRLPGMDLADATVVYYAQDDFARTIPGTATLSNVDGDSATLTLQWARADTRKKPGDK